jgi:hypothetical protein
MTKRTVPLTTLVKKVRATMAALKSDILRRVLVFFSALRCVAPIFSALKASIQSIENLRKSQ